MPKKIDRPTLEDLVRKKKEYEPVVEVVYYAATNITHDIPMFGGAKKKINRVSPNSGRLVKGGQKVEKILGKWTLVNS